MSKHKRYLIIVENLDTGYVIGFTGNFKRAKKVVSELADKQIFHLNYDGIVLFENDTDYITFKIPDSARYILPRYTIASTNGAFSAYVLDTRAFEDFSLRKFIFERSNTFYAYDIESYDSDKTVFVKGALYFIAN